MGILFAGPQLTAASREDSKPVKRMLVFGDSLSDGFNLKRSQAYPALLAGKLAAIGLNYEVLNASASGGTTEGGLRRLPPHLKHRIDVFVLELGINDFFLGEPVERIRHNLQEIIDQVKARHPRVRIVICGMQLPNLAADDYVAAFGRMYADLAASNQAALVPYLLEGVGGDPLLNQPDHIHPNVAGQRVLAENVWRVLEPIVRDTTAEHAPNER